MSARFWGSFSPGNVIWRPRIFLRVADDHVEGFVGPVPADPLERIGIGEARDRGDRAADDPKERRPDLGARALFEIVAGLADLSELRALRYVGLGAAG